MLSRPACVVSGVCDPSTCDHRVLRGSPLTAQFPLGPAQAPFAKGHLDNGGVATVIDPGFVRVFLIPLP